MARRMVVAAGLALLVVVAAGCGLLDPGPEGRVLVLGDSLTVGADQQGGLGADSSWDWTIKAVVGATTQQGIEAARGSDVAAYDAVIVAMGTNDFTTDAEAYGAQIDDMMAALDGADRVIWVNVDANEFPLDAAADGVNAALAAAVARHPNLEVADWSAEVASTGDMAEHRAPDGVHYDAEGYRRRARWMEELVEES